MQTCRLLYSRASVKIPRARNFLMLVRTRLVALLLFGSGFCALVYQTTWLRQFRLIFGASTAATAAVLGVFMVGGVVCGRSLCAPPLTSTQPHSLSSYDL